MSVVLQVCLNTYNMRDLFLTLSVTFMSTKIKLLLLSDSCYELMFGI